MRSFLLHTYRLLNGCQPDDTLPAAGCAAATEQEERHLGLRLLSRTHPPHRRRSTDRVMEQIGQQCREQASDQIWHRISMIEPTVVIILAVLVGVILLSVMLPLMSIMSEIG